MNSFLEYIQPGYTYVAPNIYLFNTIELIPLYSLFMEYYTAINYKNNTYSKTDEKIRKFLDCIQNCSIKQELCDTYYVKNILYECHVNISLLYSQNGICNYKEIKENYAMASNIFPERAEPFYYFGLYCKPFREYLDDAYNAFKEAKNRSWQNAINVHPTLQKNAYGAYVLKDLIDCCSNKEEQEKYIFELLSNPEYNHLVK